MSKQNLNDAIVDYLKNTKISFGKLEPKPNVDFALSDFMVGDELLIDKMATDIENITSTSESALPISDVVQQRELLIDFTCKLLHHDPKNECEELVDKYLDGNL